MQHPWRRGVTLFWWLFASAQTVITFLRDFDPGGTVLVVLASAIVSVAFIASRQWAGIRAERAAQRLQHTLEQPLAGSRHCHLVEASGSFEPLPAGYTLRLFVEEDPGVYYPHHGVAMTPDGRWSGTAAIGRRLRHSCDGQRFVVHLILLSTTDDAAVAESLEKAHITDVWLSFPMRSGMRSVASVEVVRDDTATDWGALV
ncbi:MULTISPECIES: hypothetical protein [unclassified Rathayibacter]|uniref:hypothetical protein n=1 Tax=unclassified Rathayibacter TaxID=2609250 RepID=UPI00188CC7B9|nr:MULTISPECIES: hypothetical protein [unclassified Rathayibacter]MBF4463294.1 hypothetical protein [Rathayibacter sp. VKM Ac-2879]MBF4504469.1 hypothetical protein [Rathayibacter sp. VKM Ac-2878]